MRAIHDRASKTVQLVLTYTEWVDLPAVSQLVRIDGLTRTEEATLRAVLEALERPEPQVDYEDIKDLVHHD
jgi:hypothetical protein